MRVNKNPVAFPNGFYSGTVIREENGEQIVLGFITPLQDGNTASAKKAFESRKKTVDGWAGLQVAEDGSFYRITDSKWVDVGMPTQRNVVSTKALTSDDPLHPREIVNELLDGFKIQATAVRHGGHFSGKNTLWRVLDPRGFELEITSGNLAFIIDSVGIDPKGVIRGKCVWGRASGKNILVPEESDTYKMSHEIIDRVKAGYISLKDVKRGAIVEINGEQKCYFGAVHFITFTEHSNYRRNRDVGFKILTRYVLANPKAPGVYSFESSVKISKVLVEPTTPVTPEHVAEIINALIAKKATGGYVSGKMLYAHHLKSHLEKAVCSSRIISNEFLPEHMRADKIQLALGNIKVFSADSKDCHQNDFIAYPKMELQKFTPFMTEKYLILHPTKLKWSLIVMVRT